jgi:hypothetical protein
MNQILLQFLQMQWLVVCKFLKKKIFFDKNIFTNTFYFSTICAFAPETRRSHQMLLCMQSMLPHLLLHMEEESINAVTAATKNDGVSRHRSQSGGMTGISSTSSALKLELTAFATLGVEMRVLANSCDVLTRGPTRSLDFLSANTGGNSSNSLNQNKFL